MSVIDSHTSLDSPKRDKPKAKRSMSTVKSSRSPQPQATRAVDQAVVRLVEVAANNEEHASFLATLLNVVADAAETSHLAPLIDLLERPDVLVELRQRDPLAPARLRGLRARQRLLEAEGGVASGKEFAALIHVSRQAVDKRRQNGTLIALHLGKKGFAYPVWQAGLEGLGQVLAALASYDSWTQTAFMLTENSWLDGETPLVRLRRGGLGDVLTAANQYGEQTARGLIGARVKDQSTAA